MVVVFLVEYDLTRDGRVVVTCFSGLFRSLVFFGLSGFSLLLGSWVLSGLCGAPHGRKVY